MTTRYRSHVATTRPRVTGPVLVALAVSACGGAPAEPPRNVAPPSAHVRVAPTDALGWIALAPAADAEVAAYLPAQPALQLVLPDAPDAIAPGTRVSVIGARGGVITFTAYCTPLRGSTQKFGAV